MNTPIADFVRAYASGGYARLHVPGHKGVPHLGCEPLDITEIFGGDDLYHPDGIILESEHNATTLFGSRHTFYSAGGSSQSIRAMLYLALLHHGPSGGRTILAARNAHKAFLYGCALLDLSVAWMYPQGDDSLCSCLVTPERLEDAIQGMAQLPFGVYVTSPDYLGQIQDIEGLARVCQKYDVPLLVDNAHGAYLHFLANPIHPLDLGAAMCCDSAHKTLPVLTGGSYLHISKTAAKPYEQGARNGMALFGSTSPSYLILQSLDLCNEYLSAGYRQKLAEFLSDVAQMKGRISASGIHLRPSEPLKIVLDAPAMGISGYDLSAHLRANKMECEFADHRFVVLMLTPETDGQVLRRLEQILLNIEPLAPMEADGLLLLPSQAVLTPRQAIFAPQETIPVARALGRICANPAVSCPPAIPIVVSGERITESAILLFQRYQIHTVDVVAE